MAVGPVCVPAAVVTLRTQEGEYEAQGLCSCLPIDMDHQSGHCISAPPTGDICVTVAPLSFPPTVAAHEQLMVGSWLGKKPSRLGDKTQELQGLEILTAPKDRKTRADSTVSCASDLCPDVSSFLRL